MPRSSCGCAWSQPRTLASRLLDRSGLATLPEPEPLIGRTLDRRTVALLAGHWGTGKSFLGLDWAASIATGKRWQARATQPGSVLYVASEGAYGLHGRLETWEYAWQSNIPAQRFHVLPVPVQFGNRHDVLQLRSIVADLTPDLVVIDTIARCAVGLDENSARDMGMVVDVLYKLRDDTGNGTVLAIHHTGKDRQTVRGSSAIEAGVDTVYTIEGDAKLLKLERTKRKDGPLGDVLQLSLRPVEAMPSAVLESVHPGVDNSPRAQELLSTFRVHFGATGATKAELRVASGQANATYARALNDLVYQGVLVNHGTDKRPFYREAEADADS